MKQFLTLFLLLVISRGTADVVIETYTKGSLGFGNFENTSKTEIKGIKKREDGTFKFTGDVMGFLAGKPQRQSFITRLDKDLIWTIDHNKKTYTESPINILKSSPRTSGITPEQTPKDTSKPEYRILKSEIKVTKGENKKTINNFLCNEYIVTWTLEVEKIETKEKSKLIMTTTLWTTKETDEIKKVAKEEQEFNKKLAEKVGIEISPEEQQQLGIGFFSQTFNLSEKEAAQKIGELTKEFQKIDGYPIVTEVKWAFEGDTLKKEKKSEEPEAEEAPSGFGGMLKEAFGPKPKPESKGLQTLFYSYREIKSLKTAQLEDKGFEVPTGYKLIK